MVWPFVFEQLCSMLCYLWASPFVLSDNGKDKSTETKFVSINNNCSIDGCNTMKYEETEYCLRHEPSMVSEEETEQEENWWSDGE